MAWATSCSTPMTAIEYSVLRCLADHCANADGTGCFVGMDTIARETRISRASVWRALTSLENKGVIRTVIRGTKRGKSNHYRILVDTHQRLPSEIAEGSPMDTHVPEPPNLFTHDLSRGETPPVAPRDTPDIHNLSRSATSRPVASDTRPVALRDEPVALRDATCRATRPEPYLTVSNQLRACASATNGAHFDATIGDWVACGATAPGCELFTIPEERIASGRAHLDALRAQLAGKCNPTPPDVPQPALDEVES